MRKTLILIIFTFVIACKSDKEDPIDHKDIPEKNFQLVLDDTIFLGANTGKIIEYQTPNDDLEYSLSVIIENEYKKGEVLIDTFSDGSLSPWFGIYATEPGKMFVNGIVLEEALDKKMAENDSVLEIVKTSRHFSKEVFVLDTVSKKRQINNWD